MSCRQSRRSYEMDSVKRATSSEGPDEKRPLRETGEFFFMPNAGNFGGTIGIVTRGIRWPKALAAQTQLKTRAD